MFDLLLPLRSTVRPSAPAARPLAGVERLFDAFDPWTTPRPSGQPAAELWEDADAFRLVLELPGMEEKDIHIEIEGDVLTISGERRHTARDQERLHHGDRWYGAFQKRVVLPTSVDHAQISATFRDGLLTVRLPKEAAEKPRTIAISKG